MTKTNLFMLKRLSVAGLTVLALSGTSSLAWAQDNAVAELKYYNPAPVKVETVQTDVCIYGGNSAGVAAALQLARLGKKCVIVEPSAHLGGLSAGGLGETDIGNKKAIGGIAHEFYQRVGQKYGMAEEWRFEPHVAEQVFTDMVTEAKAPVYLRQFLKSVTKQGGRLTSLTTESGLTVQARVFIDATYEGDLMAMAGVQYAVGREANATYNETLNGVQVQKGHQFNLAVDPYVVEGRPASGLLPGINPNGPGETGSGDKRIQAYNFRLCLTTDPGNRIAYEKPVGYNAQEYELLARYLKAGFPKAQIFQKFDPIHNSTTSQPTITTPELSTDDLTDAFTLISKFRKPGGPFTDYLKKQFSPGLVRQIDTYDGVAAPSQEFKQAFINELNQLIQGALLYTDERFAKVELSPQVRALLAQNPTGDDLKLLNRRLIQEAYPFAFGGKKYQKVDKNNHGAVSTDYIGANYDYPEANYGEREKIFQAHVTYTKGLLWFLGHDPRVPQDIRDDWNKWGLARDEFVTTGGWPHQLYVREARRLVSDYVMTESNCVGHEVAMDSIGLAAYTMDSHNTQRFVRDGRVMNEGNVQVQGFPPYPISYRSIVPKKAQCDNLLVPVCLAASHIAYGSIRMEPVFMILGQSAATAAGLAVERNLAVQDVPYPALKTRLQQSQQVLSWQVALDASTIAPPPTAQFSGPVSNLSGFFDHLKAGDKQTVVVYGTSLTAGGAWTSSMKNWFAQQYPGQVNFVNSGLSGKTSQEGVDQLQAKVLDLKPDLVFIEFAINDAHVRFNMPVEQSAANLDKIVSGIQAQNPKAAIVLQTMNQPYDAPNGGRSLMDRPQLAAYMENYRTYAREHNLLLIDHAAAWRKLQDTRPEQYRQYLPDGLHPNGEASNAVTWPAIRQMLEAGRDTSQRMQN